MSGITFDNQVISITGVDRLAFDRAFEFFGLDHVVGYEITSTHGLILYWAPANSMTPLPFKMTPAGIRTFCWEWLNCAGAEMLGSQPDHDGSNKLGWRIYNEEWTHVNGRRQALCAVQPIWAMYGK